MTRLSVNVNKVATLRNARGGDRPNVKQVAIDCERFGAQGITVHPRPDERHIKYADVKALRPVLNTEFNVEGYPSEAFMELVTSVRPDQVTLVPDPPDALTSSEGWDTIEHKDFLKKTIRILKREGIRVSIFMETDPGLIRNAVDTGTDRIELYTEGYARAYPTDPENAVTPYIRSAELAHEMGLELNAGHDLDLDNLGFFAQKVPHLQELSIGHAVISDALYYGLENTIQLYKRELAKVETEATH